MRVCVRVCVWVGIKASESGSWSWGRRRRIGGRRWWGASATGPTGLGSSVVNLRYNYRKEKRGDENPKVMWSGHPMYDTSEF